MAADATPGVQVRGFQWADWEAYHRVLISGRALADLEGGLREADDASLVDVEAELAKAWPRAGIWMGLRNCEVRCAARALLYPDAVELRWATAVGAIDRSLLTFVVRMVLWRCLDEGYHRILVGPDLPVDLVVKHFDAYPGARGAPISIEAIRPRVVAC